MNNYNYTDDNTTPEELFSSFMAASEAEVLICPIDPQERNECTGCQ